MDQQDLSEAEAGVQSRVAAAALLRAVLRNRQPLDDALGATRAFDRLEGPDRGFARAIASTCLRRLGQIDDAIDRFLKKPLGAKGADARDLLRIGAVQILFMDTPPHAAVSTIVSIAERRANTKPLKGVINAILRRISDQKSEILAVQSMRLNTPSWLWRSWERRFGPHVAPKIARAHLREAPLDLTCAEKPEKWAELLDGELLPTGTIRRAPAALNALAGFEEGAWWAQDAAAALPAKLLGDAAGRSVIDLCAAPGGKTLQLASCGAKVTAVDKSEARLERLRANLARTRLAADIVCEDALEWRPAAPADAVLLDAPCSATGTIRRHPDLPWIKTSEAISVLSEIQRKLIDAALDMLKPGGVLVYCVCSMQAEEGPAQIAAALARHSGLSRIGVAPSEIGGLDAAVTRELDLQTLPHFWESRGGMDGFFAARLRKPA
ncbi:MAG: transcription antitermination factor NusB [Parvularculaceae bacterium]